MTQLPPRCLAIAQQVALGRSDKEIAQALGIANGTLRAQLSRTFLILRVHNRTQLAVWYLKNYGED